MTAIEIFIKNYNNQYSKDILEQSITTALLDPKTTDNEIRNLFSSFKFAKYITKTTLKQCINLYAEKKRLLTIQNDICNYIKIHTSIIGTYKDKYDFVLEYIISDNGYKRMFGRHLWDELEIVRSNISILDYDEDIQGRFALSILQDMMFPKNRLPKLLQLFNSRFKSVRHILICSLSPYTMNYFGIVKKMIEDCDFTDSKELNLFKKFIQDYDKKFDIYYSCKELHSQYSLPEEYEIARKEVSKFIRTKSKESISGREDSFLNLFTQVAIGRGGGWRNDEGKVHTLGKFSFSQEMPMMLHSLSPLEHIEYNNNVIFKNWKDCIKTDETKNC